MSFQNCSSLSTFSQLIWQNTSKEAPSPEVIKQVSCNQYEWMQRAHSMIKFLKKAFHSLDEIDQISNDENPYVTTFNKFFSQATVEQLNMALIMHASPTIIKTLVEVGAKPNKETLLLP